MYLLSIYIEAFVYDSLNLDWIIYNLNKENNIIKYNYFFLINKPNFYS
jgi:hypothetical protein